MNLIVLFWPAKIASERSLPTFSASMSNAAEISMSRDVVAAEVDVHEAGDGLGRVGVAVVVDALHERGRAVAHADDRDADLVVLVRGPSRWPPGRARCSGSCSRSHLEVEIARWNPAAGRSYSAAGRVSSPRTCQMRCTTVMTDSPAST